LKPISKKQVPSFLFPQKNLPGSRTKKPGQKAWFFCSDSITGFHSPIYRH
jgi:hypothetical protein